jgi:tRNA-splicing ligase RtcB (3'-phosphate/5'-hydroxy nucleic acid ligase)
MNLTIPELIRISDYEWEIPSSARKDMRTKVRIFASRSMLDSIIRDLSLEQAMNAATLPGVVDPVVIMPDVHQGYGFPIGGVAATRVSDGVISPGAIGYDINCGVRLLASMIPKGAVENYLDDLATELNIECPSGVGTPGKHPLRTKDLEDVCIHGARWALNHGFASERDLVRTEEQGAIEGADFSKVSQRAKERGLGQLGTLGSGNHFLELDVVERIIDEKAATIFGLREGNLVVQIHCGSRGLGHQICSDYVLEFQSVCRRYRMEPPDRELVCAPISSPEGQDYLGAMKAAANFAFCNRQLIAHGVRRAFERVLEGKVDHYQLNQVYDITHNMAKIETHVIDGKSTKLCVHRKGATRAFGPHSPGLPMDYVTVGQPVFVPGSMGSNSWVLVGTEESMSRSWGSSCHGAGRTMSRSKAKKDFRGETLKRELAARGITIRVGSVPGLAEEAPKTYKDVNEVIEIITKTGLAKKVAVLSPVIVIKG